MSLLVIQTLIVFGFIAICSSKSIAQCPIGKQPFENALIGGKAQSFGGCSRFDPTTTVEIKNQAVVITINSLQQAPPSPDKPNGLLFFCDTIYTFPYKNAKMLPVIIYRAPVRDNLPVGKCNALDKKIFLWGSNRTQFKRFVSEAIKLAEDVRDFAFRGCGRFDPPVKFTLEQVNENLKNERIATTAINYLNALAFRYFFCRS